MYKLPFFLSLIVFSLIAKSQNDIIKNISYFDSNGKLTYVESAFYFRQNTDTLGYYRSFYANTKQKYFEGRIINYNDTLDCNNRYKGICKWYYSNGILKNQSEYNDDGVLNGLKKEFDAEGKLIKSSVYENGKLKDNTYVEFNGKGQGITIFNENFTDNTSKWYLNSSPVRSSKIRIGGLEMINKEKTDYVLFTKQKKDSINFSIETTINSNYLTLDSKAGVIFCYSDINNYNYFYISKNRFYIGFVKNGINNAEANNRFSEYLKGFDWNNIKITTSQDSLIYTINNNVIMISKKENELGNMIGLSVNNGSVMFDNLIIKQSHEIDCSLFSGRYTYYNNVKYPLKGLYSGVLLSESGFVLSNIKNIDVSGTYFVSVYINDTLKRFRAEIYIKNDFENTVVFKIINPQNYSFKQPVFTYQYLKSIESEKKYLFYYLKRNETNNEYQMMTFNGDLNYLVPHQHHLDELKNYGHSCIGSPVFDISGNILGVIESVNESSKIKIKSMQDVMQILFHYPEVYKPQKKTLINSSEFNNGIRENLVIIESL